MKDEYVRRGLLQGNTTIPTDGVPTLVGNIPLTYVDGQLVCENLLAGKNSAEMILNCDLFGQSQVDLVSFTSNTASHVMSVINLISYTDNTVDPAVVKSVYSATIANSCLVLSAPNSTRLSVQGISNSVVANAADALGFLSTPDPRSVSIVGELSSSPSREEAPSHNKVSYISKYEDRTSEAINRAVDSIARNVEDIYLKDSESRPKIASIQLGTWTPPMLNTDINGEEPKAFYVRTGAHSDEYRMIVATGNHSIYTPLRLNASYETFRDAYEATYPTYAFPVKYSVTDSDNIESIKVERMPLYGESGLLGITSTFGESIHIDPNNRRVCIGNTTSIEDAYLSIAHFKSISQPYGKMLRAGVFKGENLFKYSGSFTVLDQVTIRVSSSLPDFLLNPGFIIALISEQFSYGYRITTVVDKDKLIVEPLQDIEYRLGAKITNKQSSQNLVLGASGEFSIFLGDTLPKGTSLILPLNGKILTLDIQPSYLRTLVSSNNRDMSHSPQRVDKDMFAILTDLVDTVKKINSPNISKIVDSLHALMNSSSCSRGAAFRVPNTPYAVRLMDTYSDSVFGARMDSGSISITPNSSAFTEFLIRFISRQDFSSEDIIDITNEVYTESVKSKYAALATLTAPSINPSTIIPTAYGLKTAEQLAAELEGSVNRDNPLVRFFNLLVLSCAPLSLPSTSAIIRVRADGVMQSSRNIFSAQDIGRDFELKSDRNTYIVRMVEFYTGVACRFIDLETGLNIKSGTYVSIVGLFGIPQQQAVKQVYLGDQPKSVSQIVVSHNTNGTSNAELVKIRDLSALSKSGISLFSTEGSSKLYLALPLSEFFVSAGYRQSFIYSLPMFDVFRLFGVHDLTPQFVTVDIDYKPAYNHASKFAVYLTIIIDKVNYSGFYEIKRCIPNTYATTVIFEIEPLTYTAGYARTLGNLKNDVEKLSFLDASPVFIITDDELDKATPCSGATLYELVESNSYKKVSDLKTSIVEPNIIDLSTENTDAAVIVNASNTRTALHIDNSYRDYKDLVGVTPGIVPVLKITDTTPTESPSYLSNKNLTASGVSIQTEYSRRPTVLIDKTLDATESAIAVNRTAVLNKETASNGLISIRDDLHDVRFQDNYSLEKSALYVEGNTVLNGKVSVVSDNRNSNSYLTNYYGTGVYNTGGIDSHLNPTTCASVSSNSSLSGTLTHGQYADNLLPRYVEYGKFLGEGHILKILTPDMFEFQVSAQRDTYRDVQLYFEDSVHIRGSDLYRSCRWVVTNAHYDGYIIAISIDSRVVTIRFKTDNMDPGIQPRIIVFGREWNANIHRLNVSNKIYVQRMADDTRRHGIYSSGPTLVVDNIDLTNIPHSEIIDRDIITTGFNPGLESYVRINIQAPKFYRSSGKDTQVIDQGILHYTNAFTFNSTDGGALIYSIPCTAPISEIRLPRTQIVQYLVTDNLEVAHMRCNVSGIYNPSTGEVSFYVDPFQFNFRLIETSLPDLPPDTVSIVVCSLRIIVAAKLVYENASKFEIFPDGRSDQATMAMMRPTAKYLTNAVCSVIAASYLDPNTDHVEASCGPLPSNLYTEYIKRVNTVLSTNRDTLLESNTPLRYFSTLWPENQGLDFFYYNPDEADGSMFIKEYGKFRDFMLGSDIVQFMYYLQLQRQYNVSFVLPRYDTTAQLSLYGHLYSTADGKFGSYEAISEYDPLLNDVYKRICLDILSMCDIWLSDLDPSNRFDRKRLGDLWCTVFQKLVFVATKYQVLLNNDPGTFPITQTIDPIRVKIRKHVPAIRNMS